MVRGVQGRRDKSRGLEREGCRKETGARWGREVNYIQVIQHINISVAIAHNQNRTKMELYSKR